MLRLLKSENPRWWLGIGAVIGLGMMTKSTMAFFAAGHRRGRAAHPGPPLSQEPLAVGRRWPRPAGLPAQPDLADPAQFYLARPTSAPSTPATCRLAARIISSWINLCWGQPLYRPRSGWPGCISISSPAPGRPYRALGWMYVIPLVLFLISQGARVLPGPGLPHAAGCRCGGDARARWLASHALGVGAGQRRDLCRPGRRCCDHAWPVTGGSGQFRLVGFRQAANWDLKEEIGWPELAQTVAQIYHALPAEEKPRAGIFTATTTVKPGH